MFQLAYTRRRTEKKRRSKKNHKVANIGECSKVGKPKTRKIHPSLFFTKQENAPRAAQREQRKKKQLNFNRRLWIVWFFFSCSLCRLRREGLCFSTKRNTKQRKKSGSIEKGKRINPIQNNYLVCFCFFIPQKRHNDTSTHICDGSAFLNRLPKILQWKKKKKKKIRRKTTCMVFSK